MNQVDKSGSEATRWYIYAIAFVGVGILMIRFTGGLLYICQEHWCQKKLRVKNYVVPSPIPILKKLHLEQHGNSFDESRNPIVAVAEEERKLFIEEAKEMRVVDLEKVKEENEISLEDINSNEESEDEIALEIEEEEIKGFVTVDRGEYQAEKVNRRMQLNDFAEMLKESRKEGGITKAQLSEITKIKKKRLRKFEYGYKEPSGLEEQIIREQLTNLVKQFGNYMKNLRKEKKIKLKALANVTGIPKRRLREIEFGIANASSEEKQVIRRELMYF